MPRELGHYTGAQKKETKRRDNAANLTEKRRAEKAAEHKAATAAAERERNGARYKGPHFTTGDAGRSLKTHGTKMRGGKKTKRNKKSAKRTRKTMKGWFW